jgi:hypothetical protein
VPWVLCPGCYHRGIYSLGCYALSVISLGVSLGCYAVGVIFRGVMPWVLSPGHMIFHFTLPGARVHTSRNSGRKKSQEATPEKAQGYLQSIAQSIGARKAQRQHQKSARILQSVAVSRQEHEKPRDNTRKSAKMPPVNCCQSIGAREAQRQKPKKCKDTSNQLLSVDRMSVDRNKKPKGKNRKKCNDASIHR